MDELNQQVAFKREFGELICEHLTACIKKIAFPAEVSLSYPSYQAAQFQLVQDPFSGQFNLKGIWQNARGEYQGHLQFQSDDSCYAEYNVCQPHPNKPAWFIDNALAWGKIDTLKTELSLLPSLE